MENLEGHRRSIEKRQALHVLGTISSNKVHFGILTNGPNWALILTPPDFGLHNSWGLPLRLADFSGERKGNRGEYCRPPEHITAILKKYWGYTSFLPLQEETISSILAGRDTLTMLATGGGKSLCFQLPALLQEGLAVVISPLISLMKDQVDGLERHGNRRGRVEFQPLAGRTKIGSDRMQKGEVKLLYHLPRTSCSRIDTLQLLEIGPSLFFCDRRGPLHQPLGPRLSGRLPQPRRSLRETFKPHFGSCFYRDGDGGGSEGISWNSSACEIPQHHIGPVDRPNLTYRVRPRTQILTQVTDLLEKHCGESGIIYCLRRDDVDTLSARLNELGFKNLPYHAGLDPMIPAASIRIGLPAKKCDVMVATIAFGMGIDRSNIRFVIHTAMPKSIEHYHQETGRAGRDGLPAYCYLFYGGSDYLTWKSLLEDSPHKEVMLDKLQRLYHFCSQPHCRHKVLANYFGQDYEKTSCEACDYCLNELEMVEDPLIVGQKILSCVYRVHQVSGIGFGAGHIANVLKGNRTDQVETWGHQGLSTFGLMADESVAFLRYMIEQLIGQGYLRREGEFSTLSLTDSARKDSSGESKRPSWPNRWWRPRRRKLPKRPGRREKKNGPGWTRSCFNSCARKELN